MKKHIESIIRQINESIYYSKLKINLEYPAYWACLTIIINTVQHNRTHTILITVKLLFIVALLRYNQKILHLLQLLLIFCWSNHNKMLTNLLCLITVCVSYTVYVSYNGVCVIQRCMCHTTVYVSYYGMCVIQQ